MLSVTYFYREPRKTGVSIEGIFKLVKNRLADKVAISEFYCDGNLSRIQNTLRAGKYAGDINHITGDVNFLALGLRGKKNVLTVHDMGHYDTLRPHKLKFFFYKWFWYRLPLKYIDIVTVVSSFTKQKLIEYTGFPAERIVLIPNPVKPLFKFAPKEKLNDIPRILMMGTGRHKNLGSLIEAANGMNIHLDIVGWPSAEDLKKLKNYSIGYTVYNRLSDEEIYIRFMECDILFNASYYEGFGMPIIEAQAVGRPVITSNIGAMKEVAGESAILVDPSDTAQIREGIQSLVNDKYLYDDIVARGQENVLPFTGEHVAESYCRVYENLWQK